MGTRILRKLTPKEEEFLRLIQDRGELVNELILTLASDSDVDGRWLNIGMIDIQKGFMSLTRAVEHPPGF